MADSYGLLEEGDSSLDSVYSNGKGTGLGFESGGQLPTAAATCKSDGGKRPSMDGDDILNFLHGSDPVKVELNRLENELRERMAAAGKRPIDANTEEVDNNRPRITADTAKREAEIVQLNSANCNLGVSLQETIPAVPSTSGTQWQQFPPKKEEEHQRYQQQNQRQEEEHKQLHQPEGEKQHRTGEQPEQGKPIQKEQTQHNHLQQSEQNEHLGLEQQQPQVLQQPESQLPHQMQLQQPHPQLAHQMQLQQPQPQAQLSQQVQIQQPQLQLPHQVQVQQPLQQPQQQLQQLQPQQSALNQVGNSTRRPNMASHSISFGSLIPMILPHISKDQSQRLQALYSRLRRNEVCKEDFLRATRNVVGDQMLVQAVRQMQLKQQTQLQSTQSAQPNQQQQQHSQSSLQQTAPQPNLHPQQLTQNLNQRNQRAPDYQLHSQTITSQSQADSSHSSLENNVQHSGQMGEPHPELAAQQMTQTSALNLHQVKHGVDRTAATFQPPNQQQQLHHHHLQAPQASYSLYGRGHGNYQSHAYPVGTSSAQPNAGKAIVQDSQTRQSILPQGGGVQAQAASLQLNTKAMGKYEIAKVRSEPKRREDEERITRLQSGGASHLSSQPAISQQQSIWSTTLDKDQAGSIGIPSSGIVKQEVIDPNDDRQHKGQTQQPMTDMQSAVKGVSHAVPSHELVHDQGQPLLHGQPHTEVVDHQSVKTSGIASSNIPTANQPVGSAGLHFDHPVQVVQVPVATSGTSSATNLHHSLPMYGAPISGGHSPGISVQGQMRVQLPSTSSSAASAQIRTPPKKPLIGQKKPFELAGPTTQLSSKKQKVTGGLLDQSIDQLNDVTAVSGVNLREEEEQLLSGPKEESRATEALRRVVQEEEEKLVLQKGPMRNKIAGIMAKCGIKNVSSDVERCLSMSVEERLRTMLSNLIRLSKQRVDLEKSSHKIALTSDVRRQILLLNKKAREDWEKKQAEEAEKLRKLNEAENTGIIDGEKDEARAKAQRAQKEEDDKMRANAANVAARAAVGGDDMLSKWKMMAEQARQKREGASDGVSNTSDYKEANRKATVGGLKSTGVPDHQEADNKGLNAAATGSVRSLGRNLGSQSQTKPARTISLKDIIALLEREPQMSKSTLLYRLYEKGTDCVTEKISENRNHESIFP